MMILAHGLPESVFWVVGMAYVLVSLGLVLPGVLARKRYRSALLSVAVGLFLAGVSVFDGVMAVADSTSSESFTGDAVAMSFFLVLCGVFVTGCVGVYRWFRLPRY